MKSIITATLLAGTACFGSLAFAQTQPTSPSTMPPPATTPAPSATPPRTTAAPDADRSQVVAASELEQGANSFTEGQARSRFEDAGITNVQNLAKDEAGFWRGRGMRGGATVDVAMDFRGRIAAGPGVASLTAPSPTRTDGAPTPAPATAPRGDGMSPPATPPRTGTTPPPATR